MSWILLLLAGLLEIVWAIAMKQSAGFTKLVPTLIFLVTGFLSFALLALATRELPIGTAYAVWTGIAAVGTAILGIVLFGESRDVTRLACIGLIVIGVAGLRLFSRAG